MAKRKIINLLEKSSIGKDLKKAYSFMLLSQGYSADDIKILDEYEFIARKKSLIDVVESIQDERTDHRRRKQRSLPQNLVCYTSTSDVYNNKDHTLYKLNDGVSVTKGRLVWSVIKLYQQEHSSTFEEVEQLFNNKLNLLGNTIIDKDTLDNLRADRQKRYYYHESDLLKSKDGIRYAVSNQWSIGKMDTIISFALSMGWTIEVVKPETK